MAKKVSARPKRLGAPGATPSPYAYKHLLSDSAFLKVKQRAQQVQGISLSSIDFANNEVRFKVNSVSRPGLQHNVVVVFNPVDGDVVERMGVGNVAAMLRRVGIRVYCSCEAWWYWGYQYKSERRSYNAYKLGPSFPKVRNPHLQGFVCFAAGTKVLTEEGYRSIETIEVGDRVYTHKGRLRPVVAVGGHVAPTVGELEYGGDGTSVICTPGHRFFCTHEIVQEDGGVSYSPVEKWPVGALKRGDCLVRMGVAEGGAAVTPEGYIVEKVWRFTPDVACCMPVYNLTVEEDESYILEDGLVTSNCKHLWATLGVLASGTIMNSVAKKMKNYVSEQQLEAVSDALKKLKLKII